MNPLDETVVAEPVVKAKKTRKPKKVEPEPEPAVVVPEPEPVSLPVVPEPEPEPVSLAVCPDCGEPTSSPFSDAEMDVYRRINAYKRKLLRLKKLEFVSAEV